MDKRHFDTASIIVMSLISVLAITLGVRYNQPDNVHLKYGFPLTWGTHTISTIQGSVDVWNVNVTSLAVDLLIWMGLTVLFHFIVQMRTNPKTA
jgi:hypothetical protein